MSHAPRSFFPALNGGDAAILYCFVFLYFVAAGPGAWAIDIARGREPEPVPAPSGRDAAGLRRWHPEIAGEGTPSSFRRPNRTTPPGGSAPRRPASRRGKR